MLTFSMDVPGCDKVFPFVRQFSVVFRNISGRMVWHDPRRARLYALFFCSHSVNVEPLQRKPRCPSAKLMASFTFVFKIFVILVRLWDFYQPNLVVSRTKHFASRNPKKLFVSIQKFSMSQKRFLYPFFFVSQSKHYLRGTLCFPSSSRGGDLSTKTCGFGFFKIQFFFF